MPRATAFYHGGVYCWLNLINGKLYVGSAKSFRSRKDKYRCSFKKDKCHNKHLGRAWKKYGADAFEWLILERCSPEMLLKREQHWIDFYESTNRDKGYNICPVAGNSSGTKHGPETKQKMSEYAANRPADHRARLSEAARRKRLTEEHKRKIGNAGIGRTHSAETLAKMIGQKRTEETRAKMSEAGKGRCLSEESREKIRQSLLGRTSSEETKAKLRADQTNKRALRKLHEVFVTSHPPPRRRIA